MILCVYSFWARLRRKVFLEYSAAARYAARRILATHFSHSGNPLHEELEVRFKPLGVEIAYDGLEIVL